MIIWLILKAKKAIRMMRNEPDRRQLTEAEACLVKVVREHGAELQVLVERLEQSDGIDRHWVGIGRDMLKQGLMALNRAIGKPESF